MARKRVKMSATKQAYLKEEKRIKAWKSRAEKRGYTVPESVIPTRPKRYTKQSVQRLKELTPPKLYGMSTYTVQTPHSKITLKGTKARKNERRIAAQKAQQTRRENIESLTRFFGGDLSYKPYRDSVKTEAERVRDWEQENAIQLTEPEPLTSSSTYEQEWKPKVDKEWTDERRKQDEIDKAKAQASNNDWLSEGQIIYKRMLEKIDEAVGRNSRSAENIKNVLESEISQYGFEPVMKSIGMQSDDVLELTEVALNYRRDTDRHQQAVIEIVNVIRGTIPTAQELQELSELAEQGEDYDISY